MEFVLGEGLDGYPREGLDPRWHSPDGFAAEVEISIMVAGIVIGLRPELVVETGAYHGGTSRRIGEALAYLGSGRLLAVEQDPECVEIARERTEGLPVEVIEGDSRTIDIDGDVHLAFIDCGIGTRGQALANIDPLVALIHDIRFPPTDFPRWNWINLPTPRGLVLGNRDWKMSGVPFFSPPIEISDEHKEAVRQAMIAAAQNPDGYQSFIAVVDEES